MAPIVVRFTDKYDPKTITTTKDEKKILKSGKPISLQEFRQKKEQAIKQQLKNSKIKDSEEDVKNDLALDRLLTESHILTGTKKDSFSSGAELTLKTLDHEQPIGNTRVRTLDNRMRSISAVNGSNNGGPTRLEKMPMAMRKGMIKSRVEKINKYEKEAKDAGIVLSKTSKGEFRNIHDRGVTSITDRIGTGVKKERKMRDRGLKINTIGRSTKNGLVISKNEIEKLTSKPKSFKKGKKGGRY